MANLFRGVREAATGAFNLLRGEVMAMAAEGSPPHVEEIVHSDDDDDDDVQFVEPPREKVQATSVVPRTSSTSDFDRQQSRFKAPARNSIVGSSLEHASAGPSTAKPKGQSARASLTAGSVQCAYTAICERYVGATTLLFHHDRREMEIQFLTKNNNVNAINKYCKPLDVIKRVYFPFNEVKALGHIEDESFKLVVLTVVWSCRLVTLQANGLHEPAPTPECAFAFDDDMELAKMQSLLAIHFDHMPCPSLLLETAAKYQRVMARKFKSSSRYFAPIDDAAHHPMTTRRAEKRKMSSLFYPLYTPSTFDEPMDKVSGNAFASSRARLRDSMATSVQPSSTCSNDHHLTAMVVVDSPRKPRARDEDKAAAAARQHAKDRVVLHYPVKLAKNRITLTEGDVDRLVEGEFLNDNLMDFFFKYCYQQLDPWQQQHMYFFSTHFYTTLAQQQQHHQTDDLDPTSADHSFDKIRRWTKNVSIFTHRFLFVPINDKYVRNAAPCILFFDSLNCHNKVKIVATLQAYLAKEFQSRHPEYSFDATRATLVEPEVPRQTNSCDCGVFVLLYALELIKRYPGGVMTEDVDVQCRTLLNQVMFGHQNVVEFRDYLQTLLGLLSVWQQAEYVPPIYSFTCVIFDTKDKLDHAGMGLFTNSFTC
ncbi:hypothetical protein DYB26_002944 [Aphanomyces astaci]|uniref:Ubiquitin-like protease family profile domain-containing protein n=2 Tax=Aphanomyces astaci TaxID=112090 RepID=A0A3R6Z358_APHAT|nr:hypothetical protein DYB26_002944 [Aphanomyces astaci]